MIPRRNSLVFLFLLVPLLLEVSSSAGSESRSVVVIRLDGVINAAALDLVKEGLDEAQKTGAKAIVLLLETPGGLWDATYGIVRLIEQSSIPVVSFVYPKGATAWSAGTFIVLSSHVAAMAPYSVIGSCQPRTYPSGELVDDPKLVNALKEFLVQRAGMRGRNRTIAEEFVIRNRNIGAEDAKNLNVIEVVASTIDELLLNVDGMNVEVEGRGRVVIQTENAEIHYYGSSIRVRFLRIISDPTIAYILFILGFWGLIFGFLTIGFEGEIIGGILLILGLIGLGFYVDMFVAILLILGGILIYVEMREPGLQFIGPAGVLCILIGSLLLLRFDPVRWLISPQWYWFFMLVILALISIVGAFSMIVLYKVFRMAKRKPAVLKFIGEVAVTIDEVGPDKEGFVRFHGEYWKARSHTDIKPGQKVRIVAKEGLILTVEPVEGN